MQLNLPWAVTLEKVKTDHSVNDEAVPSWLKQIYLKCI